MKQILLFLSFLLLLGACKTSSETPITTNDIQVKTLKNGVYRAELILRANEPALPFNFTVKEDNKGEKVVELMNDEERITLGKIQFSGDSVIMPMKIFNTEIRAKIEDDNLVGIWVKKDFEDYKLPFSASYNNTIRFNTGNNESLDDVSGTWAVDLHNEDGSIEKSVGIFRQTANKVAGTIMTPTGDYRFLEGIIDGKQLKLSCFDGEHAFLFHADIEENKILKNGTFWSGKHWKQPWSATKDSNAKLPDANTLTYLKDGYETISFNFPDLEGNVVSLADEKFQNKVVVIQLMGSWCPNCLDETQFLAPMYKNRKAEGLEVVALAYERLQDKEKLLKRLNILKDKIEIEYPILIAGTDNKIDAAKTLPMLNHILAFPTTIFVDKKGKVRKIHTGFSGPGTGEHYDKFTREFNLFVDKLLAEG